MVRVAALVAALLLPQRAAGDGGTVRLVQTAGPFTVTVFSAPEPLRVGAADVSVLVQDGAGAPVLDATIAVALAPPPGVAGGAIRLAATRTAATNKLLYAARFEPPAPGAWTAEVSVARGTARARVTCALPVTAARAPGLAAVWPWLALPPAAIALYALHARLRRRSSGPDRPAR